MLAFLGFPDWAEHPALRQLFTSMLALNPPDHTRLRRLVSGAFTARRVQALRPAIERMVDELLDGLRRAEVDFVERFAFPLPVNVIGELLGVPAEDRAQFQPLVRDGHPGAGGHHAGGAGHGRSGRRRRSATTSPTWSARRRREPGPDLISALVAAEDAGDQLTEDELLTMAGLLFAAGFETTTNLLANGLMALLEHPGQAAPAARSGPSWRRSRSRSCCASTARCRSSAGWSCEPIELGGVPVEPGERVVAYLGAGNRDPERFADPDELRLERPDNAPLSFGGGIHFCLGAPLARLEAQVGASRAAAALPAAGAGRRAGAARQPEHQGFHPDADRHRVARFRSGRKRVALTIVEV